MARCQGSFRLRSRLLAGAALLLFQGGVQAAPWSDDSAARSDYERISRQSRKSAAAPEFDSMRLSVRIWATKGHGRFQSGFPDPSVWCAIGGGGCGTLLKSQLTLGYTSDFKEAQHPLIVFDYELRVLRRLSFDVEVGGGNYGKGNHYYNFWVNAPNMDLYVDDVVYRNPLQTPLDIQESKLRSSTRMLNSNAYFRLLITPSQRRRGERVLRQALDVFAGYTLYEDTFRLSSLSQIASDSHWVTGYPQGPVAGLDARQTLRWEGFRFGFREELEFSRLFSLTGRFAYAPDLEYQGASYLNLNTEERQAGPSRVQTARGRSFDWTTVVGWSPWRFVTFEMGYMWAYLKGGRGTDKIYLADGSVQEIELEKVMSKRHGVLAGFTLKY